jgi:membrane protein implicated in regulation of membrane protease activity
MEPYWWWAIVGIALMIAELITGTVYLLVIGIAALVGAAAAYLNYSFGIQAGLRLRLSGTRPGATPPVPKQT